MNMQGCHDQMIFLKSENIKHKSKKVKNGLRYDDTNPSAIRTLSWTPFVKLRVQTSWRSTPRDE